ncbi:alpha/beta hydrolase [Mycobacterium sp. CVI_P3]|uniref:Alpha/beta hydrolase n=1 Tax=Mycobacterium pinniadriaticum TaxID=2994102 RepID=A0ABT3SFM3_9MYCO|nr:alpha/beta hydrolase [Mycobacterium pinniadriaticum]MCX2931875.1 alpha/beta hydrolase [Mycobacterium pinniadriaticum]MCX2938314.1 alpha/beta hydrolase [Mycobacterium pinniadriaticum]
MANTDIHPELRSAARFTPRKLIYPRTLPILRRLTALQRPKNEGVEVLTLESGVGIRLYRPAGASATTPALLWIHGGGYVLGTAAQDDVMCRRFVKDLGITVAAVDYRLAPEHPYPAPLEDCYTALEWLAGLPAVDENRIAIGGASAGGGLTAALALLARDRAGVKPVFQLLVYPMIDDRSVGLHLEDPGQRLWNATSNRFGWQSYLGGADPEVAVPARRTDLAGLPPAWLGVGTLDLFHDEDLDYADRLRAAGVPCDVHVVPGAFHGFDGIAPKADISNAFFYSQCESLRQSFGD